MLALIGYGCYRAVNSDGWDDSNMLNWIRLFSHTVMHPADFAQMYYINAGLYSQLKSLGWDMLGLADALGVDRFTAGGASMGCGTALFAALHAPERIDRLVLVIPPTAWETRTGRGELISRAAGFVRAKGVEALSDIEDAEPMAEIFVRDFPEKKAHNRAATLAMEPEAFPVLLEGAGSCDFPPKDAVAGLTQPALILSWETDATHPVSTGQALAELLPNASFHVAATLADVRAWPNLVRAFLGE